MVRLREFLECLHEAGVKMRVAKCDIMKSEIKYLGQVVSAEGVKPDPKAAGKLRDWEILRNKTKMPSFLGFGICYLEFIAWYAKLEHLCLPSLEGMPPSGGGLNNNKPSTRPKKL